jgi:transcription elongation factor Elf1
MSWREAQEMPKTRKGRCVICGAKGSSSDDFICDLCGSPFDTTLYCKRCHRRLELDKKVAKEFLKSYGFFFDNLDGLVLKVSACSRCMKDDEKADLEIYRIKL